MTPNRNLRVALVSAAAALAIAALPVSALAKNNGHGGGGHGYGLDILDLGNGHGQGNGHGNGHGNGQGNGYGGSQGWGGGASSYAHDAKCPPGLAKKGSCLPPGIRKKFARGDHLPRDLGYQPLQYRNYGLPRPREGQTYVRVGTDAYLISQATRLVLEAITLNSN